MPPQEPQQKTQKQPLELSTLTMRILAIALGGVIFFALLFLLGKNPKPVEAPVVRPETGMFEKLSLEARAVLVWDVKNERPIFGRDARKVLPLASISKIMTALVAYETINADTIITISSSALATEGNSGLWLGERWERDPLITYVLVTSSNDGAAALAEYAPLGDFVSLMNAKTATLELFDTSFVNPTGLDEAGGTRVNRGSAYDVAKLFAHAQKTLPDLLDATRFAETDIASLDRVYAVNNTNEIANRIPWAIGGKTGFTDAAGGNLVVSFDTGIGHPIVVVVLGSSREGRFNDMQKLVSATHTYFENSNNATVDAS